MASLLNILFSLMVAVISHADARRLEGGVDSRCRELEQDGRSLRTTLSLTMFECTSPLFDAVMRASSTLDYRLAVDHFCNELEPRVCVGDIALVAQRCLRATDLLEFRVAQDNLRMALAEVCLRRGVRVATLFQGVVTHTGTGTTYPLWQVCYLNLEHLIGDHSRSGDSVAKYKFLKHFQACVATLGADQTYVVNASVDLLNKIIEKFKCVHPLNKKKEIYCYVLGRDSLEQWIAF